MRAALARFGEPADEPVGGFLESLDAFLAQYAEAKRRLDEQREADARAELEAAVRAAAAAAGAPPAAAPAAAPAADADSDPFAALGAGGAQVAPNKDLFQAFHTAQQGDAGAIVNEFKARMAKQKGKARSGSTFAKLP